MRRALRRFLWKMWWKIRRFWYRLFPKLVMTENGFPYPRDKAKNCVGKGWAPLIDRIYDKVDELKVRITVLQVKEKFGGLRFYFAAHKDVYNQIDDVVQQCERDSFHICEICGEPGEPNCPADGYWISTTCELHR